VIGTEGMALDEIRTNDRFNFNTLYDLQYENDDNTEFVDSPFNNIVNKCEYYESSNLNNQLANDTRYNNISNRSYFHLNCRGLSSNWDKFYDLLCDIHTDEFSFDFIGVSEVFRCDRDQRIRLLGYHNIVTTPEVGGIIYQGLNWF